MSNPYEERVGRYDTIQSFKNVIFTKDRLERKIGAGITPGDAKVVAGKYLQVSMEYYAPEFDPYRKPINGDPVSPEKAREISCMAEEAFTDLKEKEDWVKARWFFLRCANNLEKQGEYEDDPMKREWATHFKDVTIFLRREGSNPPDTTE